MSVAYLVVKSGPRAGDEFPLESELIIGRDQAAVTLDDDQVSRRHARLEAAGGEATIEDLDSTNGTWLNGSRLEAGSVRVLLPGDEIRVGKTILAVEYTPGQTVIADPVPYTAAASATAPPAAQPVAAPTTPFSVAEVPASSGIATRDVRVQVVTIVTIVATAAGLIVYFALR